MPTPLIPNITLLQRKLAGFPIATYQAGETVLAAASTSGRLLILKKGVVTVLKEGVEIGTEGSPAPYSAKSPRFSISLTRQTYVRSRRRNFTSLTPPPSSG